MIYDKEKVKQKMIEFTSDFYWENGINPRFKDYHEKFNNLSVGTINNYLKELCNQKKIQKQYNKNNFYYELPKKHVTTKYFFILTVGFILFLVTIAPLLFLVKETVCFYIGNVVTLVFWRFFSTKKVVE